MADTIREKIILAAIAQAAKITQANGYQYDMSAPKRGEKHVAQKDMSVSVIFPGTDDENERKYGKDNLTMTFRVESHSLIGSADPGVIQEKMLGDLRVCFTNPADVWSTDTDDILYQEGGPAEQPEPDEKSTAVYALFTIKYKTDIGNPYVN